MEIVALIEQILGDYWQRMERALEGLTPAELGWRPDAESNSIAFIVWHVARVEDRWIQVFAQDIPDVWTKDGWHEKLGLSEDYDFVGLSVEQLGTFPAITKENLDGYRHAVQNKTQAYLKNLDADGLDFVPGRTPTPERPGSLERHGSFSIGRMFRQTLAEYNQHLGQVSYIRGIQRGLDK
ncbi:MAG: DinB family protein [Dehalococcoidia bacterium]